MLWGVPHKIRGLHRNMNPFLLIKIQEAHDAAVVAREELEKVLDTINLEGVESEEYHQNMQGAEESVSYSIQIGLIPMDLVTLLKQQEMIPVQIEDHMLHIAGIMNEMKEYVEDALDTQDTEEINESLTSALEIAQEIENQWELIRDIAEEQPQIAEGQPVHLSSNNSNESNNESNNEFSGGYKKRTLRKKRTEKRHAKRREKRTAKRTEKRHAKRREKRTEKRREKRTHRRRYF